MLFLQLSKGESGHHLHRHAVLDAPLVGLGSAVGDNTKGVLGGSFGSTLPVVLVEMDAHFVRPQGSVALPYDVFNRLV